MLIASLGTVVLGFAGFSNSTGQPTEALMSRRGTNSSRQNTTTRLLRRVRDGSRSAFDKLVPIVYEEMRELAHAQRRRWRGDETLNTTALVHEAYLKLAAQDDPRWESRAHFRSVAARAMRQILIDYSRGRLRGKRGGDRIRVPFDELRVASSSGELSSQEAEQLIALDESLLRLCRLHDRQSRVVECRFFGAMTIADTAEAIGISSATVRRDWAVAKAWLYRDMHGLQHA